MHFDESDANVYDDEYAAKQGWWQAEEVLQTIERTTHEWPYDINERALELYERSGVGVNMHRPWYWLKPEDEFMDISNASWDLQCCDALLHHMAQCLMTKWVRRELEDDERAFVQALHFNRHMRRNHDCSLTWREACYYGVDPVLRGRTEYGEWHRDNAMNLYYMRHQLLNPKAHFVHDGLGSSEDETLECVRDMFAAAEDDAHKAQLFKRYRDALSRLKDKVLRGSICGTAYHTLEYIVRVDAYRDGLSDTEFDSIVNDVDRTVDYTKPRVHFASFD